MKHGFVKVAAASCDIRVADVDYNTEQICRMIDETTEAGAKVVVFRSFVLPDIRVETCLLRMFFLREQEKPSGRLRITRKRRMRWSL